MNPFADGINNASTFIVKNISTKKTINVFGINISPGYSYNLMNIQGVTEDDIKVSLVKGVLKRKINSGELSILQSDLDLTTSNSTQNSFLTTNTLVSGSVEIYTSTITQAKTLNFFNKNNGMLVYVESVRSYFKLDNRNSYTADNITIVQVTGGYLLRIPSACPSWALQLTWYIDPANSTGLASDENTGASSSTPLLTWEEFNRRLGTQYGANLPTSNFTTNIMSSGANIIGDFLSPSANIAWNIVGAYTYDATDTVNTITAGVASSNTRGSVKGNSINFASYTQKIIEAVCTGGTGLSYAVVQKDLGTNTANVTQWLTQATTITAGGTGTNAAPIVGAAIRIISPVTISKYSLIVEGPITVINKTLDLSALTAIQSTVRFISAFYACLLTTGPSFNTRTAPITLISCCIPGTNAQSFSMIGGYTIYGGCSFRNIITQTSSSSAKIALSTFELQNASFANGNSANNNTSCYVETFSTSGSNGMGLAVWDFASGTAITNRFRGIISQGTHLLCGGGNLVGFANTGGAVLYYTGSLPTITGTTELNFNGSATAIPPLVASSSVPAASALTTWSNLSSAPFSGNVISYTNGSSIILSS